MNPSASIAGLWPSLALLNAETFRAAMEYTCGGSSTVAPVGSGDGHPVVIFPGLGGDGSSVATLRRHCSALGYDAFDWGQGFNTGPRGDLDTWLRALQGQLAEVLLAPAQPATLIGWSLGGLYASKLVLDVEVQGSHFGLGWNRQVLDTITECLGHPHAPR